MPNNINCEDVRYLDISQINTDGTVTYSRKYVNIVTSLEVPANQVKGCVDIKPLQTECVVVCNTPVE